MRKGPRKVNKEDRRKMRKVKDRKLNPRQQRLVERIRANRGEEAATAREKKLGRSNIKEARGRRIAKRTPVQTGRDRTPVQTGRDRKDIDMDMLRDFASSFAGNVIGRREEPTKDMMSRGQTLPMSIFQRMITESPSFVQQPMQRADISRSNMPRGFSWGDLPSGAFSFY